MSETSVIVACAERQVFWFLGAEPAKCVEQGHQHRQHEMHRHLDTVELPDGNRVAAASFPALDSYARDRQPDYGLYLDRRWQPPWPHDHFDWPDFGVPGDRTAILKALRSVLARVQAGEQVELGCLGGHGRTGTALAFLAILAGCPRSNAVGWVRTHYCPQAVETSAQEEFIAGVKENGYWDPLYMDATTAAVRVRVNWRDD
jgi:protein-tyrosine phosphatase